MPDISVENVTSALELNETVIPTVLKTITPDIPDVNSTGNSTLPWMENESVFE